MGVNLPSPSGTQTYKQTKEKKKSIGCKERITGKPLTLQERGWKLVSPVKCQHMTILMRLMNGWLVGFTECQTLLGYLMPKLSPPPSNHHF